MDPLNGPLKSYIQSRLKITICTEKFISFLERASTLLDWRFGRNREDELFMFIVKAAKSVCNSQIVNNLRT